MLLNSPPCCGMLVGLSAGRKTVEHLVKEGRKNIKERFVGWSDVWWVDAKQPWRQIAAA